MWGNKASRVGHSGVTKPGSDWTHGLANYGILSRGPELLQNGLDLQLKWHKVLTAELVDAVNERQLFVLSCSFAGEQARTASLDNARI